LEPDAVGVAKGATHEPEDDGRIRLLLLDKLALFRASLARLLASENGFEVAGEAGTAVEALEILHKSQVDIVLMDFDLGPDDASSFIGAARKAGYQGRFLIVAGAIDTERSARALRLGVAGVFLKSEAAERLVQAIRIVAAGSAWIDHRIVQLLAEQCLSNSSRQTVQTFALDSREQRILQGILGGLPNRRIAAGMGLSESAIKKALQGLFARTGVRTRSQLVRRALESAWGGAHKLSRPVPVEPRPATSPPASQSNG